MKKILILLIMLAICVLFSSCIADNGNTTTEPSTTEKSGTIVKIHPSDEEVYSTETPTLVENNTSSSTLKITKNYAKYGKYIDKSVDIALNDFPDAEKLTYKSGAYGAFELKITDTVGLIYDNNICTAFYCTASDLYPGISSTNTNMTKDEFEGYLKISANLEQGDAYQKSLLSYTDEGYYFWVYCETNDTIILNETSFTVKKHS